VRKRKECLVPVACLTTDGKAGVEASMREFLQPGISIHGARDIHTSYSFNPSLFTIILRDT